MCKIFSTVQCNICKEKRTAILESGQESCIMNCTGLLIPTKCVFWEIRNAKEQKESNNAGS